jgi:hypothetical protein
MSFLTDGNVDVNQNSGDLKLESSNNKFVRKEHNSYDYYFNRNSNEASSKIVDDTKVDQDLTKRVGLVDLDSSKHAISPVTNSDKLSCVSMSNKKEINDSLTQLVGLQEKFFYLILECCNITKSLQTPKLKTTDIAELIQGKFYTTKSVMTIVANKGFVQRLKGKASRFSFVQFAISKEFKKIGNQFLKEKKEKDQNFIKFIDQIRQTIIK